MGRRQSLKVRLRRASDRAMESFASETYTQAADDALQLESYKPILQSFKGVGDTLKTVNNAWQVFDVICSQNKNNEKANKEIRKATTDDLGIKEIKESLRRKGITTNFAAQQHLCEFDKSSDKIIHRCNNHSNRRSSSLVLSSDYLPPDMIKKEANGYKWKDRSLLQSSRNINLRAYIDVNGFE